MQFNQAYAKRQSRKAGVPHGAPAHPHFQGRKLDPEINTLSLFELT